MLTTLEYSGVDAAIDFVRSVLTLVAVVTFAIGIAKFAQRLRVSKVTPQSFPRIDPAVLAAWRRLRLRAIDVYLFAAWGVFLVGVCLLLAAPTPVFELAQPVLVIIWLVGLIAAGATSRKANRLELDAGIDWPPTPAAAGKGPRACPECGERYDPADYRDDAVVARCPRCNATIDLRNTALPVQAPPPISAVSGSAPTDSARPE